VVARGKDAAALRSCRRIGSRGRGGGVDIAVRTSESVARLTINAPSGVALAATAADILSYVADGVEIGLAPVAESGVRALDEAARALAAELQATRSFAKERETTSASLVALLKKQIATDESVGHLEEFYVGTGAA
jgi:hypothetical protein